MYKKIINHRQINSWAFKEAKMILDKINNSIPDKGYVLFETGYGPSGFPHVGTFGEIARISMVRKAFEYISDIPTKLFCISDDMDGLRKIPSNIANRDHYKKYIDIPLSNIPDPYSSYESYGDHMNAKLRKFLDYFNFDYKFISATKYYNSGMFNHYLLKVLEKYEDIIKIMLPTLGEDRRHTYSPFLPICKKTGRVLQVKIMGTDIDSKTINYIDTDGCKITTSILNGNCKLQWKIDFAMRWCAFDVDYEIYGKDVYANANIYNKVCKILGNNPPHQMFYELFLDDDGRKISKSKGNGLSISDWLKYGNRETLKFFMYQRPKKAKKFSYKIIPEVFDKYLQYLYEFNKESDQNKKLSNPIYYISNDKKKKEDAGKISFSLLLNLISVCNTYDKMVLLQYIKNLYRVEETSDFINSLLDYAINYFRDFIKQKRERKIPNKSDSVLLSYLIHSLETVNNNSDDIQNAIYKISQDHNIPLKKWFQLIYEVILGAKQGPRIGTFIQLYGLGKVKELLIKSIHKK